MFLLQFTLKGYLLRNNESLFSNWQNYVLREKNCSQTKTIDKTTYLSTVFYVTVNITVVNRSMNRIFKVYFLQNWRHTKIPQKVQTYSKGKDFIIRIFLYKNCWSSDSILVWNFCIYFEKIRLMNYDPILLI